MVSRARLTRKTSRTADLIYWSLLIITAANYSFLTFPFAGGVEPVLSPLKPIAYARLPLAVFGYFYLITIHRRGASLGKMSAFLLVFMAAVIFSIPLSPDPFEALTYAVWFIFQVLFLIKYVYYLIDNADYKRAQVKLTFPLMLMGLYFLLLALANLPNYRIGRPFPAIYTSWIVVAMMIPLFLGGLACCYSSFSKRKIWSIFFIGMVLFCLVVAAVSGKRATILCALVVITTYFIFVLKAPGKIVAMIMIPIALAAAVYSGASDTVVKASEFTVQRVEKGLDSKTATSINARFQVWNSIGESVVHYPLGVGINVGRQVVGGGLHNTYLGYLLEAGWLGFIIFMGILFWSFYSGYFTDIQEKREMLFFILLPVAIYSFTEYNTAPGQPHFIPFWIGIAYCILSTKQRRVNITKRRTRSQVGD